MPTFMENAKEMVTARGRPSGTATTKMVTPKMKKASGPSANFDIGNPLFSISHLHEHSVCMASTCRNALQTKSKDVTRTVS